MWHQVGYQKTVSGLSHWCHLLSALWITQYTSCSSSYISWSYLDVMTMSIQLYIVNMQVLICFLTPLCCYILHTGPSNSSSFQSVRVFEVVYGVTTAYGHTLCIQTKTPIKTHNGRSMILWLCLPVFGVCGACMHSCMCLYLFSCVFMSFQMELRLLKRTQ